MKEYELLFTGGLVVAESGAQYLTVAVSDGRIAGLLAPEQPVGADEVIDCTGKILFPGLIDTHSHLTFKENFLAGTKTAARGGVTTVIEMPISAELPPVLDAGVLQERIGDGEAHAHVDFAMWGGLTPATLHRVEELRRADCAGFKVFLSYAGEDYPFFDDHALLEAMKRIRECGGVIGIHAENESICSALTERYRREGRGPDCHEPSRPVLAEAEAVRRAVYLAGETGCRAMICHVSSPTVLREITEARRRGADVYAETCPHYLTLDKSDIVRCGGFAKCNPPLRSAQEADGLWELLAAGEVDVVGTDHNCYTEEEKGRAIWDAPGGFPGMDVMLPALLTEGAKRGVAYETIARVTATNAAKLFGLYPQKGAIRVGADADFAVVDPNCNWTFRASESFYLYPSARYPYEGRNYAAQVRRTFVRGRQVYRDGAIVGETGYGRFIRAL